MKTALFAFGGRRILVERRGDVWAVVLEDGSVYGTTPDTQIATRWALAICNGGTPERARERVA